MKIERIDISTTHEDYKRPIPIAVGTHDSRDNVIVRITAKHQGKKYFGYGEGSPLLPSYSGEVRDQMVDDIVKRIAPDILGERIGSVSDVLNLLEKVRRNKYYFMCAIAPVDIALFDLLGQIQKKPVFNLIRSYLHLRQFTKNTMPELPANFTISRNATPHDPKITEMVKEGDKYLQQGYEVLKVKIGVFKNSDVRAMAALDAFIRKHYPQRKIFLFPDGNQAYESPEEILAVLGKIKKYIVALEQPFHRDIPELSRRLHQKMKKNRSMPLLITDEGSSSIEEMENILLSDAAGGALLKLIRSGGFHYIIKLVQLLKKYPHFKLCPCSMTETGIGTIANLHSALVVFEHCDLRLGFGFDGPMQVIGDAYKTGRDTINYQNRKTGLITRNQQGTAIYDGQQIIGNEQGLGLHINKKYLDGITDDASSVYIKEGNVMVKSQKTLRKLGTRTFLLKHPRY